MFESFKTITIGECTQQWMLAVMAGDVLQRCNCRSTAPRAVSPKWPKGRTEQSGVSLSNFRIDSEPEVILFGTA